MCHFDYQEVNTETIQGLGLVVNSDGVTFTAIQEGTTVEIFPDRETNYSQGNPHYENDTRLIFSRMYGIADSTKGIIGFIESGGTVRNNQDRDIERVIVYKKPEKKEKLKLSKKPRFQTS